MIESQGMLESSPQHFWKTYSGSAPENYERYFVPAIGAPFAADLIESAGLSPGDRVLDVACGTGIVARLAAPRVGPTGRVTGLDLNPGMLAVAASVTPPEMAIDWREANAEAIPLPDEAFDVVFCQFGLQFMPTSSRRCAKCVVSSHPTGGWRSTCRDQRQKYSRSWTTRSRIISARMPQASFVRCSRCTTPARSGSCSMPLDSAKQPSGRLRRLCAPPRLRTSLWGYVHSTPLADIVALASDERRAALERDVVKASERSVNSHGLSFEQGVVVATAAK